MISAGGKTVGMKKTETLALKVGKNPNFKER